MARFAIKIIFLLALVCPTFAAHAAGCITYQRSASFGSGGLNTNGETDFYLTLPETAATQASSLSFYTTLSAKKTGPTLKATKVSLTVNMTLQQKLPNGSWSTVATRQQSNSQKVEWLGLNQKDTQFGVSFNLNLSGVTSKELRLQVSSSVPSEKKVTLTQYVMGGNLLTYSVCIPQPSGCNNVPKVAYNLAPYGSGLDSGSTTTFYATLPDTAPISGTSFFFQAQMNAEKTGPTVATGTLFTVAILTLDQLVNGSWSPVASQQQVASLKLEWLGRHPRSDTAYLSFSLGALQSLNSRQLRVSVKTTTVTSNKVKVTAYTAGQNSLLYNVCEPYTFTTTPTRTRTASPSVTASRTRTVSSTVSPTHTQSPTATDSPTVTTSPSLTPTPAGQWTPAGSTNLSGTQNCSLNPTAPTEASAAYITVTQAGTYRVRPMPDTCTVYNGAGTIIGAGFRWGTATGAAGSRVLSYLGSVGQLASGPVTSCSSVWAGGINTSVTGTDQVTFGPGGGTLFFVIGDSNCGDNSSGVGVLVELLQLYTATPSITLSSTATGTSTPSSTASSSSTATPTVSMTASPSSTPSETPSSTVSPSATGTDTDSATVTPSPVASGTSSVTATPSLSSTPTPAGQWTPAGSTNLSGTGNCSLNPTAPTEASAAYITVTQAGTYRVRPMPDTCTVYNGAGTIIGAGFRWGTATGAAGSRVLSYLGSVGQLASGPVTSCSSVWAGGINTSVTGTDQVTFGPGGGTLFFVIGDSNCGDNSSGVGVLVELLQLYTATPTATLSYSSSPTASPSASATATASVTATSTPVPTVQWTPVGSTNLSGTQNCSLNPTAPAEASAAYISVTQAGTYRVRPLPNTCTVYNGAGTIIGAAFRWGTATGAAGSRVLSYLGTVGQTPSGPVTSCTSVWAGGVNTSVTGTDRVTFGPGGGTLFFVIGDSNCGDNSSGVGVLVELLQGTLTPDPSVTASVTRSATATASSSATPTSSRTATASVTASSTRTATATSSATRSSTATATPTATRSDTLTSTSTRTATASVTASDTRTATATSSATRSSTATATPTATRTDTATSTATRSSTATDTASRTPSPSSTRTSTATPSATATASRTVTPSDTATSSRTPSYTASPSVTRSSTATPSSTASPTFTPTSTVTSTFSSTASPSVTATVTDSSTATPSDSPSATETFTSTVTLSATPSFSSTATETASSTATPSFSDTATETPSSTATLSFSSTASATPSITATASATGTATGTASPSSTRSGTPSSTVTPVDTATATSSRTVTYSSTATPSASATPTPTTVPDPCPNLATYVLQSYRYPAFPSRFNLNIHMDVNQLAGPVSSSKPFVLGYYFNSNGFNPSVLSVAATLVQGGTTTPLVTGVVHATLVPFVVGNTTTELVLTMDPLLAPDLAQGDTLAFDVQVSEPGPWGFQNDWSNLSSSNVTLNACGTRLWGYSPSDPTATPTASPSFSASPTASPTRTASPTASPSPTPNQTCPDCANLAALYLFGGGSMTPLYFLAPNMPALSLRGSPQPVITTTVPPGFPVAVGLISGFELGGGSLDATALSSGQNGLTLSFRYAVSGSRSRSLSMTPETLVDLWSAGRHVQVSAFGPGSPNFGQLQVDYSTATGVTSVVLAATGLYTPADPSVFLSYSSLSVSLSSCGLVVVPGRSNPNIGGTPFSFTDIAASAPARESLTLGNDYLGGSPLTGGITFVQPAFCTPFVVQIPTATFTPTATLTKTPVSTPVPISQCPACSNPRGSYLYDQANLNNASGDLGAAQWGGGAQASPVFFGAPGQAVVSGFVARGGRSAGWVDLKAAGFNTPDFTVLATFSVFGGAGASQGEEVLLDYAGNGRSFRLSAFGGPSSGLLQVRYSTAAGMVTHVIPGGYVLGHTNDANVSVSPTADPAARYFVLRVSDCALLLATANDPGFTSNLLVSVWNDLGASGTPASFLVMGNAIDGTLPLDGWLRGPSLLDCPATTPTPAPTSAVQISGFKGAGGIPEIQLAPGRLLLAPNPASQQAQVYFNLAAPADATLLVYDITGALVHRESLGTQAAGLQHRSVPVSNLGDGLYLVQILANDGQGWHSAGISKLAVAHK